MDREDNWQASGSEGEGGWVRRSANGKTIGGWGWESRSAEGEDDGNEKAEQVSGWKEGWMMGSRFMG